MIKVEVTILVDKPVGQAIGIKEQIAMDLEHFGDTKVVSVEVVEPEQLIINERSENG